MRELDIERLISARPSLEEQMLRELHNGIMPYDMSQLWSPMNDAQREALDTPADELFFGGAAGGGKSWLLLGVALTQQRRSTIFRQTYDALTQLIEDSQAIVGTAGDYHETSKTWRRLPNSRTIRFRALDKMKDIRKHQGRANDFLGFDELPHFSELQFRTLKGWLRTPIAGQRTRIVATGNPPQDNDGLWVINYWSPWLDNEHPSPAMPGELRYFARIDDKDIEVEDETPVEFKQELIIPRSRTFIPAFVTDNPFYMNTGYYQELLSLPEPLRSQLLYGDFSIGRSDHAWQVIPTAHVLDAQTRWQQTPAPDVEMRAVGVDVARGGDDKFVIARLRGVYFEELLVYDGRDVPDGQTGALRVLDAVGSETPPVFVDSIGVGSSVLDFLKILYTGRTKPLNAASKSKKKDKSRRYEFANLRAEMWWKFREALEPTSEERICLPPSRSLRAELTAPHYRIVGGKIAIEGKEDIKKRLGRSTDYADAVIMAWHGAARPTRWVYGV